jgi:hypothetical protein
MRILVVALLLSALPARGNQLVASAHRREVDAWSVSAAYFGETALHPGAAIAVERKLKFWGRRYGLVEHGFFTEADLGSYWHARNDVALFVSTDLGYRLVFPKGFRLEGLLGIGYLHTFDDGPVYVVNGGQVSMVSDAGHPALMLSALIGLGWDFTVGDHAPFSLFLRVGSFGQYPYNTAVLPHLEAQLGFSIPLERVVHRGGAR